MRGHASRHQRGLFGTTNSFILLVCAACLNTCTPQLLPPSADQNRPPLRHADQARTMAISGSGGSRSAHCPHHKRNLSSGEETRGLEKTMRSACADQSSWQEPVPVASIVARHPRPSTHGVFANAEENQSDRPIILPCQTRRHTASSGPRGTAD
jgi:hypothetical protein